MLFHFIAHAFADAQFSLVLAYFEYFHAVLAVEEDEVVQVVSVLLRAPALDEITDCFVFLVQAEVECDAVQHAALPHNRASLRLPGFASRPSRVPPTRKVGAARNWSSLTRLSRRSLVGFAIALGRRCCEKPICCGAESA